MKREFSATNYTVIIDVSDEPAHFARLVVAAVSVECDCNNSGSSRQIIEKTVLINCPTNSNSSMFVAPSVREFRTLRYQIPQPYRFAKHSPERMAGLDERRNWSSEQ